MLPIEETGSRLKTYATTFWEIRKSENYVEIEEELFSSYRAKGCNMLLAIFMFAPCINDEHFTIQQMHKYIIRRYN